MAKYRFFEYKPPKIHYAPSGEWGSDRVACNRHYSSDVVHTGIEKDVTCRFCLQAIHGEVYFHALRRLKQAGENCISNYCRNQSGILWESLWKYEGGYMQKTCTSGLFNDWKVFETEDAALVAMIEEIKTIENNLTKQ